MDNHQKSNKEIVDIFQLQVESDFFALYHRTVENHHGKIEVGGVTGVVIRFLPLRY